MYLHYKGSHYGMTIPNVTRNGLYKLYLQLKVQSWVYHIIVTYVDSVFVHLKWLAYNHCHTKQMSF